MIENENPVIANSLWTATANPTAGFPVLNGETATDVAIVGGGYAGLSAAVHLAEHGFGVVLLEAETPGWGASGRNGGQAIPGLKEDPDTIEQRFGPALGRRMVELSGGATQLVFDLIARLGIQCDASQAGWIQPFHSAAGQAVVKARVEQWNRRGAPLRLLSSDEAGDLLGTTAYRGALFDPRGGHLHPLNYALGLAEAASRAGAELFSNSRAIGIESNADGHVVRTSLGRVRARRVLICTNAYSGDVLPTVRRTVVPVRSIQVATDILPTDLARKILPKGHAASDSRRLLHYFRKDSVGRFVLGGRGDYTNRATRHRMQALQRAAIALYPGLAGIPWVFRWGGYVAMTADHYPHLDLVRPGVMAGLGFNGRGVAMATALGKVMADWAAGIAEAELPFPVTQPRPIPLYFLRRAGVASAVAWARLRDSLDS